MACSILRLMDMFFFLCWYPSFLSRLKATLQTTSKLTAAFRPVHALHAPVFPYGLRRTVNIGERGDEVPVLLAFQPRLLVDASAMHFHNGGKILPPVHIRKIGQVCGQGVGTLLYPAVVTLVQDKGVEAGVAVKIPGDILHQRRLVGFHAEDVVGFLLCDALDDFHLGADGVYGNHVTF